MATFFAKVVAMVGVLLVVTLLVGAASPELHDHLCHAGEANHGPANLDHCVIKAFAGGEILALAFSAWVEPLTVRHEGALPPVALLEPSQADCRLQPTCGPPALS